MAIAVVGFVWLHGVTTLDLPDPTVDVSASAERDGIPSPGVTLPFSATAY